jgi:tetratricopeptide (TPR) repeat protein
MNGRGRILAAAFAVLLACSPRQEPSQTAAAPDPGKQRVIEFWATFRKANQLRMKGDYETAAAAYQECLRSNPVHEDSLYYLGASLEHLGRYEEAAAAYEKLLEVNPASARALAKLGALLSSLDPKAPMDYARARRLLERLRELNPEQAGPFLQLGLLDLREGKTAAALEKFRIAARFGAPEGHYWTGCALYLGGNADEAGGHLEKVLEIFAKEQKLAGKGIRAEGDVKQTAHRERTPLERAALGSKALLARIKARAAPRLQDCFLPANP